MIAKIIVDISNSEVDRIFDYLIPSGFDLQAGDRVRVPFGNRSIEGFCIKISDKAEGEFTLKPVSEKLDESPLITPEMLGLMEFMKEKYHIRYVDSLRLFIPNKLRGGRVKELKREFISLNPILTHEQIFARISPRAKAQLAVAERLMGGGEYLSILNSEYSNSAIKALIDANLAVKSKETVMRTPYKFLYGENNGVQLTKEQNNTIDRIYSSSQSTVLIHGVTGSGKTEVYLACIAKALQEGKSAIMLVPEISLTPQMLKIFRARFGDEVAMLHSGLSDGERYDEWRRLKSSEAHIAIGARSAIFAPLKDVGIIIIDEEHDSSYISESNPRFNTVDIASYRCQYNSCKLVLGSATPSVESYLKAKKGEYALCEMNKRISANGMPSIEIIDMAKELRSGNTDIFSTALKDALINTVKAGNQAMIFLNRRGYASFMMCKECGYIAKCSDCDISLTYHKEDNTLKCHYCGKRYKALTRCPNCQSTSIKQGRVGTEKVVSEVERLIEGVSVLRMDNDTTSTKTAYLEILGAFAAGQAQVLVGTQMIAKGHDFPSVTLVGVLDADMSLYYSDYRSAERTFQLITQVAGRAGRSVKEGKVLIQTYSPKHYIFNFVKNYNYKGFFDKENNTREVTAFPPYTTIIRVLISSLDESTAIETAKAVYSGVKIIKAESEKDFIYLQAMKAPITRIQNKYRYQIIARIRREREESVISRIYACIDSIKQKNASVFVEINPQSMS